MGFLQIVGKVLYWGAVIALSIGALYIGDMQRNILDPITPDPMFTPPPYIPPPKPEYPPKPKWTERQLIDRELEIDEQIAKLEAQYYALRYHRTEEDRNYYRGGKNAAGEREGIGRVELPAGDIYMGEWKKNLRHGIGGLAYAGGDTYETEWAFGDPHGFGAHRTTEGYHYIGEFIAGQPNGFGRALYGTHAYYMGQFYEGKPHGFGNWSNGETRYEGEFVEGKRQGQGRMTRIKDGKVLFEGQFKGDQPLRAGWQPKPKYLDPEVHGNVYNLHTPTEEELRQQEEEQEVISIPFKGGGTLGE